MHDNLTHELNEYNMKIAETLKKIDEIKNAEKNRIKNRLFSAIGNTKKRNTSNNDLIWSDYHNSLNKNYFY